MAGKKSDPHGILSNGAWAGGQQTLSMAFNSIVALLLVIAVPVHEYGIYSYALALCAIGMSVMSAGLSGLAVKALLHEPDKNATIMTGLLLTREAFALMGYGIIAVVSLTSGSSTTIGAVLLSGVALFGRAADAPEMWYRANMRSRTPASIRIGVSLALFAVRILVVLLWPSIWLLLGLFAAEAVVAGALILTRYLTDSRSLGLGRPSLHLIRSQLTQSFPLLISGFANQVNLRADVVILQAILGYAAVGTYSAAARMSELAYFLPVVFMNASLPLLLRTRREYGAEHPKYLNMLQRSYDQAFWGGVLVAVAVGIGGSFVIDFFFSEVYQISKSVLWVHLIACPFVFMAAVYSKFIIVHGNLWSSVIRHCVGAAVNIALNLLLIPSIGLIGAAIATVCSYIVASYLTGFLGKESRLAGKQMTLAIIAPLRLALRLWRRSPGSSSPDA